MRKDGRSDNSILLSKWLRLSEPTPYEEGTRTARAICRPAHARTLFQTGLQSSRGEGRACALRRMDGIVGQSRKATEINLLPNGRSRHLLRQRPQR